MLITANQYQARSKVVLVSELYDVGSHFKIMTVLVEHSPGKIVCERQQAEQEDGRSHARRGEACCAKRILYELNSSDGKHQARHKDQIPVARTKVWSTVIPEQAIDCYIQNNDRDHQIVGHDQLAGEHEEQ